MRDYFYKLVFTSVDDCRVSCEHIHDPEALEAVLRRMDDEFYEHKSRRQVIARRIRKLEKQKGIRK